jgi:hypothetical protein
MENGVYEIRVQYRGAVRHRARSYTTACIKESQSLLQLRLE